VHELKVLYTAEQIEERVEQLADQIRQDYGDRPLVAVIVLKGAIFFATDLLRKLTNPIEIYFVELKTYAGTETTGEVKIHYWDEDFDIEGRDVLVIEDILDTGITLDLIIHRIEQLGAHSVRVCCLLEKPARRRVDVQADYVGFIIDDQFVVGYGLDYRGKYRNLPYIAELVQKPAGA